ncbi:M48 family metallopeptidase [Kibdelosporangium aridum]|uniref:Peptidase M48 domain-containing protein n=1 Tax=Kibdelosporangium aridum TaxID=2030 RepID=A0A1W2FYB2_KIBAR|nr:M48 family metallopeptidase [Kibdelosporangium aridum]SMD26636.1 hypothetical protein SAMN05661093_10220 [Kibdelosporangium aridum]
MLAGYLALLVAIAAGVLTAITLVFSATWAALVVIVVLLWLFLQYVLRPKAKAQAQQDAWINRKIHPDLWRMVDEVAEVAETRTPDEIRLGPDMRATLREQGGFRCLVVGLPLLGGLSTSELRAVTGHELAHFQTVSPLESRLPRVVLLPYRFITKSQNRTRNEQAEAVAISAAGEEAAKSALMKLPALVTVWHDFRLSAARVSYQYRTPDLVQRFNTFLTTPEGTEALAKAGVPEWTEHGGPAWELLTEPDKSLPYLQRQLFEELGPERTEKTV